MTTRFLFIAMILSACGQVENAELQVAENHATIIIDRLDQNNVLPPTYNDGDKEMLRLEIRDQVFTAIIEGK